MKKKSFWQRPSYICFRVIRRIVQAVYPRISIEGMEYLPDGPCLLVGNHAQMNGPIVGELYIPGKHTTWCASEMMHIKEVPAYAYKDFWSMKPGWIRWFYRILSYIIAPLSACIFNNASTIPVYRDARIITTFRETVTALLDGARVTIFPEEASAHNNIVNEFQEGFVDVARLYHRKSGKALPFVPIYIAPDLKKVYMGEAVYFDPQAPKAEERRRICSTLMDRITEIARSLPEHTVIPYLNMSRKDYPKNIPCEVKVLNEKACC